MAMHISTIKFGVDRFYFEVKLPIYGLNSNFDFAVRLRLENLANKEVVAFIGYSF